MMLHQLQRLFRFVLQILGHLMTLYQVQRLYSADLYCNIAFLCPKGNGNVYFKILYDIRQEALRNYISQWWSVCVPAHIQIEYVQVVSPDL